MDLPNFELLTTSDVSKCLSSLDESADLPSFSEKVSPGVFAYFDSIYKREHEDFLGAKKVFRQVLFDIKSIKVYLSFAPSLAFTKKIHKSLGGLLTNSVMDIVVDEELIGGVRLVVNGKIYDESIKTKLDTVLQEAK